MKEGNRWVFFGWVITVIVGIVASIIYYLWGYNWRAFFIALVTYILVGMLSWRRRMTADTHMAHACLGVNKTAAYIAFALSSIISPLYPFIGFPLNLLTAAALSADMCTL